MTPRYLYRLSRLIGYPLVPPELLIISLTESCNLRCVTCRIKRSGDPAQLPVDLEKVFDVVRQGRAMKIETVVLSGGEPFLVPETFEIAAYIRKQGMKVCVTTNGFYPDQLAEKVGRSGMDHLHFSFDGLREQHDAIRGAGSYERLMRTVGVIRGANPGQSVGFGTVILNTNCAQLHEMTLVADRMKVNTMNFIPYLENNVDPQHSKKGHANSELWPDERGLAAMRESFAKIRGQRYEALKLDLNPSLELLETYYSCGRIRMKCHAGYKSMIVTAPRRHNGKPTSDVFFCQDTCGNVYDTTLEKAWHSAKAAKMRVIARACRNPCLQFCHYI